MVDLTVANLSGFRRVQAFQFHVPRCCNRTFGYTSVTSDDLIKKVKKSLVFTNFMPPVPHPGTWLREVELPHLHDLSRPGAIGATGGNSQRQPGADVARYMNAVNGGTPPQMGPVPEANDTSDPLYGIN